MPPDITPEEIRGATFRSTLRGADTAEVERFLDRVAANLEELERDRDRLASRLGEFADKDLKTEFESVGREVTKVLEAAREAAETMRERASADAARWRSESMAEAEQLRKDARNDAEALRGDAWTAGSELLAQSSAEAKRLREAAERDSLTITGEAEREAHRLVSGARREAEDLVRSATMDAEKITADAEKARDEMIETARREAEASQERTRALEQRREELMAELEGVRAALRQMEGTLEAKREDLNLSKTSDTTVRVIPSRRPPEAEPEQGVEWAPGETVRVIRGDDGTEQETTEVREPPSGEEVSSIDTVEATALEPDRIPDAETSADTPVEASADETSDVKRASAPTTPADQPAVGSGPDDLGALFESLRSPGAPGKVDAAAPVRSQPVPSEEKKEEPRPKPAPSRVVPDDVIEQRDAVLLPITNRALRGVKRSVTEAQNIALDGLRTDTNWTPDRSEISEIVRAELITLWAESYSAGHDRAEAMSGSKLKRPQTPSTDAPEDFGTSIASDLSREMGEVGEGQRERQSAASKVFRAWRTDEAERRVRALSLRAFHRGMVDSAPGLEVVWVPSGTPCSACQSAAEHPSESLPPVHAGCECTVAV